MHRLRPDDTSIAFDDDPDVPLKALADGANQLVFEALLVLIPSDA